MYRKVKNVYIAHVLSVQTLERSEARTDTLSAYSWATTSLERSLDDLSGLLPLNDPLLGTTSRRTLWMLPSRRRLSGPLVHPRAPLVHPHTCACAQWIRDEGHCRSVSARVINLLARSTAPTAEGGVGTNRHCTAGWQAV